jgi:hypothetical protein
LKNNALDVSDKLVALLATDKIPIKIALFEKLENSTNGSFEIPATA